MLAWKVRKRVKPEDNALPPPCSEISISENGALSRSARETKAGRYDFSESWE
jgi:hypothetical protein